MADSRRRSPTGLRRRSSSTRISTGQLWATWTRGSSVRVNRTTNGDQTWGAEFVPAVAGTTMAQRRHLDDRRLRRQQDRPASGAARTAAPTSSVSSIHDDSATDTTWGASTSVYPGNNFADDHLNLKADPAGNLFAVVKTSLGIRPTEPRSCSDGRRRDVDERHVQHGLGDHDPRRPCGRHDEQPAARLRHRAREQRDDLREDVAAELAVLCGRARHAVHQGQQRQQPEQRDDDEETRQRTTGLLVLAGHET